MGSGRRLNRRTLLGFLMGWPYIAPIARAAVLDGSPPRDLLRGFHRTGRFERCYRVDATVLLFGIPLFSKQGVGGGYAAAETGQCGADQAAALQFAAGSWPERCRGLNRFGVLQEVQVQHSGGSEAIAYAGLITPSKEDDLDGAKKALRPTQGEMDVTVASGSSSEGRMRFRAGNVSIPAQRDWLALTETISRVSPPAGTSPREAPLDGSTTFLQAMRRAALSGDPSFRCAFLHNGKPFVLEARRKPGAPCEMWGTILTGSAAPRVCAEFRTSYAAGDESGLPVRIEYRPKSYLRLTFTEAEDSARVSIPTLFSEEVL